MESIENRSLSMMPLLEQFHCTDNRRLTKIDGTVFSSLQDDEEGETWPPLKVVSIMITKKK